MRPEKWVYGIKVTNQKSYTLQPLNENRASGFKSSRFKNNKW